jgi:hypothetical protein
MDFWFSLLIFGTELHLVLLTFPSSHDACHKLLVLYTVQLSLQADLQKLYQYKQTNPFDKASQQTLTALHGSLIINIPEANFECMKLRDLLPSV